MGDRFGYQVEWNKDEKSQKKKLERKVLASRKIKLKVINFSITRMTWKYH